LTNKKNLKLLTIPIVILLTASAIVAYYSLSPENKPPPSESIRVACVGDSITQSSAYPYELWKMLGRSGPFVIGNHTLPPDEDNLTPNSNTSYSIGNFGVGGTLVTLKSESPYMNSSAFPLALEFQPDLVFIMLGTNDAQPSVHGFNTSFVSDYKTLISAFQALASKPKIWIVLPPPIFDSQGGKTSPEYLAQTLIPLIRQTANETGLPIIDAYSVLINHPEYFPDGVHPNAVGAKLIANEVYKAII
jgi:acyl-CoA thioesterase I